MCLYTHVCVYIYIHLHTAIPADVHTYTVCMRTEAFMYTHTHTPVPLQCLVYMQALCICFALTLPRISCTNTVSLCAVCKFPSSPLSLQAGPGRAVSPWQRPGLALGRGRSRPEAAAPGSFGSGTGELWIGTGCSESRQPGPTGTLAEVSVTPLRRGLASMSGEQSQSVIKRIIRQVGLKCAAQGQNLSETLVAFMVSAKGSLQGLAAAEAFRSDLSLAISRFPIACIEKF